MKRLCILLVILICLLSNCQKDDATQTVRTGFGDELIIHYYLAGNMHGVCIQCIVSTEQTDGYAYFHDRSITDMPSDITDHLQEITCEGGTSVYKLYDEYIILHGTRVDCFSNDYNVEEFKSDKEIGVIRSDVVNYGAEALCRMGKFEYIERFAPFLSYFENHALDDTLMLWSEVDFTKEELELNQGYTKE